MDRRTFLAGVGLAGTGALGGCLGGYDDRFTLTVVSKTFGESEAGRLVVRVVVSNVGNDHQEGTLFVHGDLNGDAIVRKRQVALDGHRTREFPVTYDIAYEDVHRFSLEGVDLEPSS